MLQILTLPKAANFESQKSEDEACALDIGGLKLVCLVPLLVPL